MFAPAAPHRCARRTMLRGGSERSRRFRRNASTTQEEISSWVEKARVSRLQHLEEQASTTIRKAVEAASGEPIAFPCALIAGDVIMLELMHRLGYLTSGAIKVLFIDTFHLFPETLEFLADVEQRYGFKAQVFNAAGCNTKDDYDEMSGADLWKEDIEEYDKICKVEPFSRALRTVGAVTMFNGRRRDHGKERAHLEIIEEAAVAGGMIKVQPLVYWEFRDIFDFAERESVKLHPLHDDGYPSLGDAKDTVRVDRDKWFEYAGERSGRFVGLVNKDGSAKSECGIHVDGAIRDAERDLWETDKGSHVKLWEAPRVIEALEGTNDDNSTLLVVYAPWCKYCQAMEDAFEDLAASPPANVTVAKLRGDAVRDFVEEKLMTKSFPSIYFINNVGEYVRYESETRTPEAISAWVAEQNLE